MKAYIGAKIIQAEPMDKLAFFQEQERPYDGQGNPPGYKVVYPDGYVSWSPKETFEAAYREIAEGEIRLIMRD